MALPSNRAAFKNYCLKNKYTKWYFDLIEKALKRNWSKKTAPCYVECHHYTPTSIVGKNKNTVYLTAREHFVCHLLLVKMLEGEYKAKMVWAIMQMKGKKERYINSFLYEIAKTKIKHSDISKIKMSNTRKNSGMYIGEKNPMFGKKGILSPIYGTKQTEQHRENRLSKIRGRKQSLEVRMLMSKNRKKGPSGKKWFNNGSIESFDLPENKPENFVFGRLKRVQ